MPTKEILHGIHEEDIYSKSAKKRTSAMADDLPVTVTRTTTEGRPYEWIRLKAEATSIDVPDVSRELLTRGWHLAFWWQVAPHRFSSSTSRYFAGLQIPGWGT